MDSKSTVVVTGKIFYFLLLLARDSMLTHLISVINSSLEGKTVANGHTNNSTWKITYYGAFLRKSDICQKKQAAVCPLHCHPVSFVVHSLHVLIFVDILSDPNHVAQGSAG